MSSSEVNHKSLEHFISSLSEFLFKQCKYHLMNSTLNKVTAEKAGCLHSAVSKCGNAKSTDSTQNSSCLKSTVNFLQSEMIWGVCWSEVRSQCGLLPGGFTTLHASISWQAFRRCQFPFPPAHSAKTTTKWFSDHIITALDWPASSPDLNPTEHLSRGRWEIPDPKIQTSWELLSKKPGLQ